MSGARDMSALLEAAVIAAEKPADPAPMTARSYSSDRALSYFVAAAPVIGCEG
jgi:hypothetical protein